MKPDCIKGGMIRLPKIGDVKMILHRPIPEGARIKQAKITRKADGFYVSLILDDPSIPDTTWKVILTRKEFRSSQACS